MKKYIANILSSIRIGIAIALFFFSEVNAKFLILYTICGFTDLLDGPIARKTNSTSSFGATLDTIGDLATYLALTKILLIKKFVPMWVVIWMLIAAVGFAISGFITLKRQGKFFLVHSLFGKILGGSVFLFPFAMHFFPNYVNIFMGMICTFASIAAIESIYIDLKSDKLETDVTKISKV